MRLKKFIWRSLKIFWIAIGIIILLWTFLVFTKIKTMGDLGGIIVGTVLLGAGIYAFFIYIALTIIILLIRFVYKLITRKNNK